MELLFAAEEELDVAWVFDGEATGACLAEVELELIAAAGEEFCVTELLSPAPSKPEDVEAFELIAAAGEEFNVTELPSPAPSKPEDVKAFGAVDDKTGLFMVLCPPDDGTVVTVAITGLVASLSIFRFRKSLPYLSIVILKN